MFHDKLISTFIIFWVSTVIYSQKSAPKVVFQEGIKDSVSTNFEISKRKLRRIKLVNDPLTPSKAAFYSAVLPGLGQAYLGKSWKIPLIYGAIGASAYNYVDNNREMKKYRTAYKRRLAGYTDDEFQTIFPENDRLLDGMKFHRSNRDISMLFMIGFYMLNIIEANVSAHLLQFNVSDDLSFNPEILMDPNQAGLRLAIRF